MPDGSEQSKVLEKVLFLKNDIGYLPILQGLVEHGFSWGKGSRNMSFSYGRRLEVKERINNFLRELNMPPIESTMNIAAEHGDKILDLNENNIGLMRATSVGRIYKCDAIFTKMPCIPLIIKPADCTVSIIYGIGGSGEKVIGLVHAGRRGLDLQFPFKAIAHLLKNYNCNIQSLRIGITPTITVRNHFIRSIGELTQPDNWNGLIEERDGLLYLDFIGQILRQYSLIGLSSEQIQLYNVDTYEAAKRGDTFSHRYWQMNEGVTNGRMIVAAQIST